MKKTLVMAAAAVLTGSMAYPSLAEEYVFEMAPVVVTANRMNENPEPDPGAFKCGVSDNYGKALEEIKSERDVYFILEKRFTYEKGSYFYDDGSCFSWNDGAG